MSAITRSEERADHLRRQDVEAYVGNALDVERVAQVVRSAGPEVLVHQLTTFPASLNPVRTVRELRQTARLRTQGTRLLVDLAHRFGIRRVVAQSIAFGYRPLPQPRRATEDDPFYGNGARAMDLLMRHVLRLEETVTQADGVEGVAIRYGGWYGPKTLFAKGSLFHRLAMARRLPVFRGATGAWNAIHVEDAASATVAALSGPPGIFNVVDDEPLPCGRFIAMYCKGIGAPPPRTLPKWATAFTGFYARHLLCHQPPTSNAKAKHELGWQPLYPSFKDGIDTIA